MSARRTRSDAPDPGRNEQNDQRGGAMETAADVRQMLAEEIATVRTNADLDPLAKGRLIAQLASAALRAIEMSNLAARVEAIEVMLKRRKNHPT